MRRVKTFKNFALILFLACFISAGFLTSCRDQKKQEKTEQEEHPQAEEHPTEEDAGEEHPQSEEHPSDDGEAEAEHPDG
ncbi:hypothetical protein [Pareuzebyella sediminis]|uniref:hypothetical protein n=1 Tax=Pareuzebyella sediminis TaxID=2607998 RepID=UPI0011EF9795|nr:hypothetical protein [Pareuzebyella sediminis]